MQLNDLILYHLKQQWKESETDLSYSERLQKYKINLNTLYNYKARGILTMTYFIRLLATGLDNEDIIQL